MYIGVDLGGTNIAVGLLSVSGEIVSKVSTPTMPKRGEKMVIDDIIESIQRVIEESEYQKEDVKSIGIGIPGVANKEGIVDCVNIYWQHVDLKGPIEEAFNLPVFIENDATVAGLAEFELGTMKGAESGIFITLGTGVGGGIVMNHKVISGAHGVGSEIGHMMVGDNFYTCNCGQNGCLETYASSTAIIKYVQMRMTKDDVKSSIRDAIENDLNQLNAKIIFDEARKGDQLANEAVDRFVKYLSKGIINLINILDPEIIALGGGVSHAGEFLREKVEKEVYGNKLFNAFPVAEIKLAKLKNDAGIIGAAFLGKEI